MQELWQIILEGTLVLGFHRLCRGRKFKSHEVSVFSFSDCLPAAILR